jgi:pimeloyl-ACP methyl ester carboxylesterase
MSSASALPARDLHLSYGPEGRSSWLDIDWREHQRWVTVAGVPLNTIDMGEGPPIVFVHGLSGSWSNWLEQLPVFAGRNGDAGRTGDAGRNEDAGRNGDASVSECPPASVSERHPASARRASPGFGDHRVIAMDLPGFGHSPMPHERITISAYARILDELLEKLGVSAATVVGNSMGGFVSTELAIAFPQRVERLVLVSAAGISTYRHPGLERIEPYLRRVVPVVAVYTGWTAAQSDWIARRGGLRNLTLGLVTRHPDRLPAALASELLRGTGKPGFLQALQANIDYPISERLPEIACPTLIVWGAEDKVIPVADASVFEGLIPDSRKVIFEDTGHLAMLERPVSFNKLLGEFLAE